MPITFFSGRGIYYGWVVVATMFLTMFMVLGLRFAFGIFYVAILEDTGWQRAETALIFSLAMGVYTVSLAVSGALFDHFGPRFLFPAAALILAVGMALCSTIESIWQFYLYYGVLVGFSFSVLGFPTHMAVIPRWFHRKRGLASGLALSGIGIGSLMIALLSQELIAMLGWRTTYLIYGVVLAVTLIPLNWLFHRQSAEAIGLNPDGDPDTGGGTASSANQGGITLLEAMRTPAWWLLFVSVGMIGFVTMTMVVHQTRLSLDIGYDMLAAAFFFGMTGLIRSVGQLTWGALSDRFGRNPIFLVVALMGISGIAVLYFSRHSPHLAYLGLFTFLISFGFMGVSPVYASIVSELFQGRHLGKIMGILDIGFGMGAFGGPLLAGYLFDLYGNYDITMGLLVLAIVVSCVTMYLTVHQQRVRPPGMAAQQSIS